MAKSAKAYFEEMCREAGLSPEETTAALAFASNDKLTGRLDSLVKTGTEDYQAQIGRVRAAEAKLAEYGQWYGTANQQYQQMADEVAALRSGRVPMYNNGNGTDPALTNTAQYLTKADLDRVVQEQGSRFATVLKTATSIAADHVARFGEKPDMEAIDTIAREQNLPLNLAYEAYIKPRVEAKATADMDKRIKDAREEAVRDYASKHRLPVDPVPAENSYINVNSSRPEAPKDIDAELLSAWRGEGDTTKAA
jgi:hypothetical protein